MVMRAELARPGLQIVSAEQYNQLFTMHGTIMMLLFATPLFAGFANAVMPLQIGAPDVAFPRLNALTYWLFLFGGLIVVVRLRRPRAARRPSAGSPTRRSTARSYSPGSGGDLWTMGLALAGLGTILGAVNFITTIVCLRAPGMTMFRMPIFTWNVLLHLDPGAAGLPGAGGGAARRWRRTGSSARTSSTRPTAGALLWQHLFWFFGHPEVYIVALPFFGIITEIIPVFSRKPIFGYIGLVGATIAITVLSATVWAHHMFATGAVLLPFFSLMSFLIAVPTGVKFFNWIGTMWQRLAVLRDADAVGGRLPRHLPASAG